LNSSLVRIGCADEEGASIGSREGCASFLSASYGPLQLPIAPFDLRGYAISIFQPGADMPYSKFSLKDVKTKLGVVLVESEKIFTEEFHSEISNFLRISLEKYVPLALAINTEKSRSEWIIAPILVELKEKFSDRISIFSGKKFDIDTELGLDGYCDYIVSLNPEQYYISSPVLIILEAKKEDIVEGLGQCIATMYAARVFNERESTPIPVIYGAVTTGTDWKFLKLENTTVYIDRDEYYLKQIETLMGILAHTVEQFA
jgi:hypothetical protein